MGQVSLTYGENPNDVQAVFKRQRHLLSNFYTADINVASLWAATCQVPRSSSPLGQPALWRASSGGLAGARDWSHSPQNPWVNCSGWRWETAHLQVLPGIISVHWNRALFKSQQDVVRRVKANSRRRSCSKWLVKRNPSFGREYQQRAKEKSYF